ncbi:MAG: hypothetical protein HQ538_04695 [Parcubacteria group bacterium]|nr:hypothetical protein [Parcubacteria group bacterium]
MRNTEGFTTHEDNPVQAEELATNLAEQYSLSDSDEYDFDVFCEVIRGLSENFLKADTRLKKEILMERFLDTFYSNQDSPNSKLFESYAMRPIRLRKHEADLQNEARFRSNTVLTDPELEKNTMLHPVRVSQYGPSTIYDCPPGTNIMTKLSEQDIIASANFSSCRAIMGINEAGEALFSHITSDWGEDDLLRELRSIFGKGDLYYAYPFEELTDAATDKEIMERDDRAERYRKLAKKHGLETITYTEVSGRKNAENEHDIRGTIISLSRTGIYLVGADNQYYEGSQQTKDRRTYYDRKKETEKHISFS